MKESLTLDALAGLLLEQKAEKKDVVADVRQMTVLSGTDDGGLPISDLNIDGMGEFRIRDIAHAQIATEADIPKKFYDRLRQHPDLHSSVVNRLLREKPKRRMVRTLAGEARAVLSDRYRRIDNIDIAEHVFPILGGLGPSVQWRSLALTETRMHVKVVVPGLEGDVKVGDTVRGGVYLSNSEVGHGSLAVYPFIERLVCLNGMVVEDRGTRRYHVGQRWDVSDDAYEVLTDETRRKLDEALFASVADVVRASVSEANFRLIVAQMQELAAAEIKADPVKAVEVLADAHQLTDDEQGSVLRHLVSGGDLSAWGYVNAVTRTAEDADSYDRATELEALGGRLLRADWRVLQAA